MGAENGGRRTVCNVRRGAGSLGRRYVGGVDDLLESRGVSNLGLRGLLRHPGPDCPPGLSCWRRGQVFARFTVRPHSAELAGHSVRRRARLRVRVLGSLPAFSSVWSAALNSWPPITPPPHSPPAAGRPPCLLHHLVNRPQLENDLLQHPRLGQAGAGRLQVHGRAAARDPAALVAGPQQPAGQGHLQPEGGALMWRPAGPTAEWQDPLPPDPRSRSHRC